MINSTIVVDDINLTGPAQQKPTFFDLVCSAAVSLQSIQDLPEEEIKACLGSLDKEELYQLQANLWSLDCHRDDTQELLDYHLAADEEEA
ncbi:MAG: hypothetical protein HOB03_01720 [Gammaproteobacteria bacterium]|nr:hypothetical protein [Gammaproteobacteria bacterium]